MRGVSNCKYGGKTCGDIFLLKMHIHVGPTQKSYESYHLVDNIREHCIVLPQIAGTLYKNHQFYQ